MTEQEAKILASELEHHPRYRAARVYQVSAYHWAVDIVRRDDSTWRGTLYGPMPASMLRELLNSDDSASIPWLYPNR